MTEITPKKGEKTAINLYKTKIKFDLDRLENQWTNLPCYTICRLLLKRLRNMFEKEVPDVYKLDKLYYVEKQNTLCCRATAGMDAIVEKGNEFIADVTKAIQMSCINLPKSLKGRMTAQFDKIKGDKSDERSYDIYEVLGVFSDLVQQISDFGVHDLSWIIMVIHIAYLHPNIYTNSTVPVASWPSMLRNSVAHNQVKFCGSYVVAYNKNKHGTCDWHISVHKNELSSVLSDIFYYIAEVQDIREPFDGRIIIPNKRFEDPNRGDKSANRRASTGSRFNDKDEYSEKKKWRSRRQ